MECRTVAFVVEEKPHPRFERDGDDLIVKLNVTLSQALLGPDGGGMITKEVDQLDGRRIQVELPEGVSTDPPQRAYKMLMFCGNSKSSTRVRKRG